MSKFSNTGSSIYIEDGRSPKLSKLFLTHPMPKPSLERWTYLKNIHSDLSQNKKTLN
jgi:hypothetical protein